MYKISARLHPSLPEDSDDHAGQAHRKHRRPGSWCRNRRELLMLTSICTLTIMLLLAKLPLGHSFFGSNEFEAYLSISHYPDEALPLITSHEIGLDRPQRPVERLLPNEMLPESDLEPNDLTLVELDQPGVNAPVAHRKTTGLATMTLHDLANTSRYMHTAITAPVVDDPPRLRIGSMLIEYPFSALKKAIEGLVIVRFIVETDGRAYGIDVVSGLEPACDAAVVNALRDARFIPGQFRGRNVPALSQMAVRFRIEEGSYGFY